MRLMTTQLQGNQSSPTSQESRDSTDKDFKSDHVYDKAVGSTLSSNADSYLVKRSRFSCVNQGILSGNNLARDKDPAHATSLFIASFEHPGPRICSVA